jgi:glycosyltransferase involved in cell wall biosynthesis
VGGRLVTKDLSSLHLNRASWASFLSKQRISRQTFPSDDKSEDYHSYLQSYGDLIRCVGTLIPQLPPDGSVEILVCDDGSTDGRKMLAAEFPSVAWSKGPRKGPAANRNVGARLSDSEWLIYVDDDCIPRDSYLSSYLSAFESTNSIGLFHGLTFPLPEPTSLLYKAPSIKAPLSVFASCNFAISKKLFEANGGFDERYFPSFEDIEFFTRLRELGTKAECVWGAAVDHPLRRIPNSRKLAARWEARVVACPGSWCYSGTGGRSAHETCVSHNSLPVSRREISTVTMQRRP